MRSYLVLSLSNVKTTILGLPRLHQSANLINPIFLQVLFYRNLTKIHVEELQVFLRKAPSCYLECGQQELCKHTAVVASLLL